MVGDKGARAGAIRSDPGETLEEWLSHLLALQHLSCGRGYNSLDQSAIVRTSGRLMRLAR